jgi:hypothetical protein
MRINIIASPAVGKPVILAPDGVLLRWPGSQPLPCIGDEFKGTTIRLAESRHAEHLVVLLEGDLLERCDAACRLPSSIVMQVYSKGYANALRRIGRRISNGLRSHIAILLREGHHIRYRELLDAVRARGEAEQLRRWNLIVESE